MLVLRISLNIKGKCKGKGKGKEKSKVNPFQVWKVPQCSMKLRLSEYLGNQRM